MRTLTHPVVDYGRVRCNACGDFYDIDEGHTCPSAAAAALLPAAVVDASAVPDPATLPDPDADEPDRTYPAGLTWVEPLMPRPIVLGPSADHPDLRPALALDAGRFWSEARHGLEIGRKQIDVEEGAVWYALAPNMRTAPERLAYLVDAIEARTAAINDYAKELSA